MSAEDEFAKALAAGRAAGTATTNTSSALSSKVFMGGAVAAAHEDSRHTLMGAPAEPKGTRPAYVDIQDAYVQWFRMDPAEQVELTDRFYRAGLISNPGDYAAAAREWRSAVDAAAGYNAAGKDITPWQVINLAEILRAKDTPDAAAGPKQTTQVSTRVDVLSRPDAEAIVMNVFRGAVGRDPEQGELDRYAALLIGKSKANPTKSTTTTDYTADGSVATSNTISTGGISSAALQQAAQDEARADPEYGAYQAATTYFNALIGALAAPA